jgi:cytochrome c553
MEARLLACAACHGRRGEGTKNDYFPRLAGKPAGYLMNQLVAFRDRRRRYPPMNYLHEYIPDPYLKKMADYFAALRPPPVPQAAADVSAPVPARGHSLVAEGDAAHGVPPCSGCHGPKLTGVEPAIPGLVGLHASYISAQLGAFRYGTRTAADPDCMQLVAASLTKATSPRSLLARLAADTARPLSRAEGHPADAARLRQRTPLRRSPVRIDRLLPAPGYWFSAGACQTIEIAPGKRGASFETAAQRPPQDEGFLDAIKDLPYPEERPKDASRRTHDVHAALRLVAFVLLAGLARMTTAAQADDALIAKGEYLARAGDCIACHTNPGGACSPAAGRWPPRSARSIHPTSRPIPRPASDRGPPISSTGPCTLVASRWRLIYPAMPFGPYTKVTREDSDAIFAYLRSVPPVRQPNRPHDLRFPFNNRQLILGWRTLFFQEGEYQPDPANRPNGTAAPISSRG